METDRTDPATAIPSPIENLDDTQLAGRVLREGAVSVSELHGPTLGDGRYVVADGTYYRLTRSVAGTERIPALRVDFEWEPGQTPSGDGSVVAYADLPAVDRRALQWAVYGEETGTGTQEPNGIVYTDHLLAYPDGLTDSRLASLDRAWIEWEGRHWELAVHGEAGRAVDTYRYEATTVATDAAGFREEHPAATRLPGDLPEGERSILETAIERDRGYEECIDEGRSDSLVDVHARLSGSDRGATEADLREPVTTFAFYEGSWYEVRINVVTER